MPLLVGRRASRLLAPSRLAPGEDQLIQHSRTCDEGGRTHQHQAERRQNDVRMAAEESVKNQGRTENDADHRAQQQSCCHVANSPLREADDAIAHRHFVSRPLPIVGHHESRIGVSETSAHAAIRSVRPMSVHLAIVDAKVIVVHARARIDLNEAADGGLSQPVPSPCKSLIPRVESEIADADEMMNLGAEIATASGEPLRPGASGLVVDLHFWSDLADVFVVPSTLFTLRYPNRVEGRGQVLDVRPF
jgi:hypothetical protein